LAGPTEFKSKLVGLALQESEVLAGRCRGDQDLEDRIVCYGRSIGIEDVASYQQHYSAVFISWCMRKAGASEAEFPPEISHWKYAQFSVRNAEMQQGVVRARCIEAYAPQSGDIVHVNRNNGKMRFDHILAGGYFSESGVVVDIVPGKARIVMGNQEPCGNVGTEDLALADSGLLIQRDRNPLIAVIEVLK
jgi:hypothetical protein